MHAMRCNNGFHVLGTYKYMKGDGGGGVIGTGTRLSQYCYTIEVRTSMLEGGIKWQLLLQSTLTDHPPDTKMTSLLLVSRL